MSLSAAPRIAGLFLCLVLWASAFGQDLAAVPPFSAPVVDTTGTLSRDQLAQLTGKLSALQTRKGSQVAVLIVPSTKPEAIEQYSLRVAEEWKVGRKKVDDGALLVVAKDDRQLRIEVGYGLEGALPDAIANRIIQEIIVPQFRAGNFYGGVDGGVDAMIKRIDGEDLPPPSQQRRPAQPDSGGSLQSLLMIGLVLVVVVGGILRRMIGRLPAALAIGGAASFIGWIAVSSLIAAVGAGLLAFFFTLLGGASVLRGPRSGGWGGGFGGGGFGGGGGGGFGGGGGGGFGGGGASGRW